MATNHERSDAMPEVISTYTTAEAVADGVLVDAHELPDGAGKITRELWKDASVYWTSALFELVRRAVENPRWLNDWRGVWWDIANMARGAIRHAQRDAAATGQGWGFFVVIITGTGRRRKHYLKVSVNADGLFFMLQGED